MGQKKLKAFLKQLSRISVMHDHSSASDGPTTQRKTTSYIPRILPDSQKFNQLGQGWKQQQPQV